MGDDMEKCRHCGQLIREEFSPSINMKMHLIVGGITGLIVGGVFDYFYFYIGVITDYFGFMPLTHILACVLIGALAGWIVGEKKELNAYRRLHR